MLPVLRTVLIILVALIGYQAIIRLVRKLWHFPAPGFIGRFLDSPVRKWQQSPESFVARSGAQPGMTVLEIGCGSGAFTTAMAHAVRPEGHVHALDIQADMLRQLRRKLAKPAYQDITNVTLHEHNAYDLPFEDGTLDLVYLVTVLPEIPDQLRALAEIKRVLKPGGILAVGELLIDPDYPLRQTTVRIGERAGFAVAATSGNFWSYIVRFVKPAANE